MLHWEHGTKTVAVDNIAVSENDIVNTITENLMSNLKNITARMAHGNIILAKYIYNIGSPVIALRPRMVERL